MERPRIKWARRTAEAVMPTVLVHDVSSGKSESMTFPWAFRDGPLSTALARHYLPRFGKQTLIIGRGVLGGRPMVGSATATMTAVSAQSGGVVESKVEGPLAAGLFRLGLDAFVLHGYTEHPVGVNVEGQESSGVVATSAADIADMAVFETDRLVRRNPADVVLTTGRLGFQKHRAGSIVTNCGFPTAQGGLGATLGEMGVKYVRLAGVEQSIEPLAVELDITERYEAAIDSNPLTRSERDFPGFGLWVSPDAAGYAASPNFSGRAGKGLRSFNAESFMEFALDDGTSACPHCPQSCLKSFSADLSQPIDGGRLHQLAVGQLATQSELTDAEVMVRFNSLCHDLGVEHLAAEEELRAQHFERWGELTAELLEEALSKPNPNPSRYHRVKAMTIPPFDPRANQGLAVGYALNPTGPRYDVLEHDIDFDPEWVGPERAAVGVAFGLPEEGLPMGTLDENRLPSVVALWTLWSALDGLGICSYAAPPTRELTLEDVATVLSEVLGELVDADQVMDFGLTRLALLRATNRLLGLGDDADVLPDVFFDQPILDGALASVVINRDEFDAATAFVRDELGWDNSAKGLTTVWRQRVDEVDIRIGELVKGAD